MAAAENTDKRADTIYEGSGASKEGFVLQTDRGVTTVADIVVAKMAGIATREVEGIHGLGTAFHRLVGRARTGESLSQGVNVEVGKKEAAIDLVIVMEYGYSIPAVAKALRENVITKIEEGTGLIVKEVNIEVDDLYVQTEKKSDEARVE